MKTSHTSGLIALIFATLPIAQAAASEDTSGTDADLSAIVEALQASMATLEASVTTLETQNADLQAQLDLIGGDYLTSADLTGLSDYLTVDAATNSVVFSGANVYIQSGSGATDDLGASSGLGNLIVGYAEDDAGTADRTGSHNLVVGTGHSWVGYGGLVAGYENYIGGPYTSVTGGTNNAATGTSASVTGGVLNTATGPYASVTGGTGNSASGYATSVSGGISNFANSTGGSVSGGEDNASTSRAATVAGGYGNIASGNYAAVSGGSELEASDAGVLLGDLSGYATEVYVDSAVGAIDLSPYLTSSDLSSYVTESYVVSALSDVGGGIAGLSDYLRVDELTSSVIFEGANVYVQSGSGTTDDGGSLTGLGNLIVGYAEHDPHSDSAVRTGSHNLVVGDEHNWESYGGLVVGYANAIRAPYASVTGGYYNDASGYYASVSGGYSRAASGPGDWVAGELFEDN